MNTVEKIQEAIREAEKNDAIFEEIDVDLKKESEETK